MADSGKYFAVVVVVVVVECKMDLAVPFPVVNLITLLTMWALAGTG